MTRPVSEGGVPRWIIRIPPEKNWSGSDHCNRREILGGVVGQLCVDARIDDVAGRHQQQRVAVWHSLGDDLGAKNATGAAAIVDKNRLWRALCQRLVWVQKYEVGALDEDAQAADLLLEYEAKCGVPTRDEAWRIAVNISKLPELLRQPEARGRGGLGSILTAGAQGQKEKAAEAASAYRQWLPAGLDCPGRRLYALSAWSVGLLWRNAPRLGISITP
jgi:hypothetical protein